MQGQAEAISPIMTKVEMAKDIHLHMWKVFAICKCEDFLTFEGANQSKPDYGLVTYWPVGP